MNSDRKIKKSDDPRMLLGVFVYAVFVFFGLKLKVFSALPPVICPAVGIAGALFLVYGLRVIPGIFFGFGVAQFLFFKGQPSLEILFSLLATSALLLTLVRLKKVFWLDIQLSGTKMIQHFLIVASLAAMSSALVKGVYSLLFLPKSSLLIDFFSVWFADTLGVIIFVPLTLLFIGPPEHWKSRRQSLILFCLLFFALLGTLVFYAKKQETQIEVYDLNLKAEQTMRELAGTVNLANHSLGMLDSFRQTNSVFNYDSFSVLGSEALRSNPLLRAVTWVPELTKEQLPNFEKELSRELKRPFKLFEKNETGTAVPLSARPFYYPVAYILPIKMNEKAIGFDLGSEQNRGDAIQRAMATKDAASTKPIKLVQDPDSRFGGLLYFVPYKKNAEGSSRRQLFNAVIDLNYLFAPLMELAESSGIQFIALDQEAQKVVGSSFLENKKVNVNDLLKESINVNRSLRIGDQQWTFYFIKEASAIYPKMLNWIILCLSILLGGATILGILIITGNNEELKKILRALSHDLANPLSVVLYYAEKNLKNFEAIDRENLKVDLAKILKSAKTQNDIIEHFKLMRAVADGKKELKLSQVSILEAVKQVETTFEQHFMAKQLTLKYNAEELQDLYVLAEKVSLNHDVLNNIVSNAIKFSPNGSVIEISTGRSKYHIQISIIDRGIGMSKEILQKIFRIDQSVSRRGTGGEKGTGFGMPVVKSYMERFGGKIEIQSRAEDEFPDDHGTVITLSFLAAQRVK